jgi:hypothetical protein
MLPNAEMGPPIPPVMCARGLLGLALTTISYTRAHCADSVAEASINMLMHNVPKCNLVIGDN